MADTVASVLRHKGSDVWSIGPDASVYDAIALMAGKSVGALLVIDRAMLVGILSERDYARKVILQGRSSKDTRVADIMTAPVISVTPAHTVHQCMEMVTSNRIRHLPVVDAGKVVGIVTALFNPSGQKVFAGMAFAVPIENAAKAVGDSPL